MALSKYITDELKARLRFDENSIDAGKVGDLWFPHMDSEDKPTLGYGHLLEDKKFKKGVSSLPKYTVTIDGVKYNTIDGIPTAAIDRLFEKDLATKDKETKQLIKDTTSNPVAQQSILEMAYQLGVGGVKKFPSMLSAMKLGRWEDAATEVMTNSKGGPSLFSQQTPERAKRLSSRIRAAGTSSAVSSETPTAPIVPVAIPVPAPALTPVQTAEAFTADLLGTGTPQIPVSGNVQEAVTASPALSPAFSSAPPVTSQTPSEAFTPEEDAYIKARVAELRAGGTGIEAALAKEDAQTPTPSSDFSKKEQAYIDQRVQALRIENSAKIGNVLPEEPTEVLGEAGIAEQDAAIAAQEAEDEQLDNLF